MVMVYCVWQYYSGCDATAATSIVPYLNIHTLRAYVCVIKETSDFFFIFTFLQQKQFDSGVMDVVKCINVSTDIDCHWHTFYLFFLGSVVFHKKTLTRYDNNHKGNNKSARSSYLKTRSCIIILCFARCDCLIPVNIPYFSHSAVCSNKAQARYNDFIRKKRQYLF